MNDNTLPQTGFFNRLQFYFTYSARNIRRGGRWIGLAIFCIAAGVATIVALRGLGLSIAESLVSTVRDDNKGDILINRETDNAPDFALALGSQEVEFFTDIELEAFRNFAVENDLAMTGFSSGGAVQIASQTGGSIITSQFAVTYLIDPETYPVVGKIRVVEPAGATLPDLLTGGLEIVISENLAQSQNLGIGDEVRIARTEEVFIVSGIVGVEAEAGINNPFGAFFGFAYIDLDTAQRVIDNGIGVNRISYAYPEPLTYDQGEIEEDRIQDLPAYRRGETFISTSGEVLVGREEVATVLGDFIVVLGLGALLIGGVGILNTMLVLVRRRTNEIAALKTFGLKGRQIALLFLSEGILLGIIGSIIGCVVGVLLGGFVNQFGEQFIQQTLLWKIYPEALVYGISLGMATTIIFSLAPILSALQIRPAIVLRPNEGNFARIGILQNIALMLIITVLLGLIVGQIVQPTFGLSSNFTGQDAYLWSVIGVASTLAILGVLTILLWVLVWLIGKLPAFGLVDLQLALRNMSTQRLRTATTLLALSAGMFALSSITFVGEGTRQLLDDLLGNSFGGNVLAIPIQPVFSETLIGVTEGNFDRALEDVEGVGARTVISLYGAELVSINGEDVAEVEIEAPADLLDDAATAPLAYGSVSSWDSENDETWNDVFNIVVGRNITPEDRGERVLIGDFEAAGYLGIEPGSTITYRIRGQQVTFTVIGLYDRGSIISTGSATVAPDALAGVVDPQFQFYAYDVETANIPQAVAELSSVVSPPTVALDVRFIDSLIARFIAQFSAIPTIVGILSLIAAAVIMANTIALSTLERRRQIGILKAIGLKSKRVLRVMLIEATVIGLLSAFLGIGLSQVGIYVFTELTGAIVPFPRSAQIVAVVLVISAVVIAWISTYLSANIAVRERVMNVLRYE